MYELTVTPLLLLAYKRRGTVKRTTVLLIVFAACVPLMVADIVLALTEVVLSLTADLFNDLLSSPGRIHDAITGRSNTGGWLRRKLFAPDPPDPPDPLDAMLTPDGLDVCCSDDAHTALPVSTRQRPKNRKAPAPRALIDSGCTAHIFQRLTAVTRWIAKTSTTIRGVASSLPSVGIGVVFGLTGLIVPSMQREILLSVARLCETVPGGQILFTATNVYAGSFTPLTVHATGTRTGNLYYMDPGTFPRKSGARLRRPSTASTSRTTRCPQIAHVSGTGASDI